jgi:hypothetical protein
MFLGQPHTNLAIAGQAVWLGEFLLERCQGHVRDTPGDGWGRYVITERLLYPPLGIGR